MLTLTPQIEETSSSSSPLGGEPVKVISEERLASLIVGDLIGLTHDRRLVGVDQDHLRPNVQDGRTLYRTLSFREEPIEPSSHICVVPRCPGKVPDQLGGADRSNQQTCDLTDLGNLEAECGYRAGACQQVQKHQEAVEPLELRFSHIMIESAAKEVEAKLAYFGGRTPGGSPFGVDVAGGEGIWGIGLGVFAHLTLPSSRVSFIGIVLLCVFRKWALGRGGCWNTHHGCMATISRNACRVFNNISAHFLNGPPKTA